MGKVGRADGKGGRDGCVGNAARAREKSSGISSRHGSSAASSRDTIVQKVIGSRTGSVLRIRRVNSRDDGSLGREFEVSSNAASGC